jgi:LysM repeat protein
MTAPVYGITTPSPIQPGIVDDCNDFHKVQSGDTCASIARSAGISLSQPADLALKFTSWNPGVGNGCSSLWLGYFVCISRVGVTATITMTTTTSGNGIFTPTPTLPGMVKNCDTFYLVKSGDGCAAIASSKGISLSQLYAWNPNLGSDCSGLWSEYYICVSIVGVNPTSTTKTTTKTTTSTKGNGVSTPTSIQAGMTSSCNKFHKVVSGDQCGTIASNAGITLANFLKWNPGVGGFACRSLWLGYYVCIGVL